MLWRMNAKQGGLYAMKPEWGKTLMRNFILATQPQKRPTLPFCFLDWMYSSTLSSHSPTNAPYRAS